MLPLNKHCKINPLEVCTSTLGDIFSTPETPQSLEIELRTNALINGITPQSSYDLDLISFLSQSMKDMSNFGNLPIGDDLIVEIEGLGALLLTIQGCTDFVSISAAIILYVRKYFDSSLTSQIMQYLNDTLEPQDGSEVFTPPQWLQMVRSARENWEICKGNKLFGHFSKLLGLVVTLGLCKASDVTFEIGEYKMFEPDLKVVHGKANDIAEAAFGTVTFFVESMYMCFAQRSLRPLLMSDQEAIEIDEEYANVCLFWGLVKTGNLQRVRNISDQEFDRRLELILTRIKNLLTTKSSFEKKLLTDKYMKLLSIKNDYVTLKISSGVRKAPFAIQLFGESSQGKTTVGDQLVDALLTSAGLPVGKDYRASYNPSDKFMSNWKTDKLVMTVDDMANDKSNFVERPPTRTIIDLCNNQPYYANMAELDKKGSVFVEPEIVIVNTNVKDLDARIYSNCPYSIQRRMDVVITVQAKRKYQHIINGVACGIDSSKIREEYISNGVEPLFDDIWNLTIERAVKPSDLKSAAKYAPVKWNNRPLKDVSFTTALNFLIEQFQAHRDNQELIVKRMASRTEGIELCDVDGCKQIKGYCCQHKSEPQFGEEIERALRKSGSIIQKRVTGDMSYASRCVESATTFALVGAAKYIVKHWDWITFIPRPLLLNDTGFKFMMFLNKDKLKSSYIYHTLAAWLSTMVCSFFLCSIGGLCYCAVPPLIIVLLSFQRCLYDRVINTYRQKLLDRNTIHVSVQNIRDEYSKQILGAIGVISGLYTLAKIYKRWKSYNSQGSLEPTNEEQIKFRDQQVNPFIPIVKRNIVPTTSMFTTSYQQLQSLVKKNLVYGTVVAGGKVLMVNGLFLRSNVVVIPKHYFVSDVLDVTFRKVNPESLGGKFATRLSLDASYHVPNTDLMMCYSSTGGSFKDLTKYLVEGTLGHFQFMMLYRYKSGDLLENEGVATDKMTSNGVANFDGGEYDNMQHKTFKGLCGAVVISAGNANCIAGFHLGGKEGTYHGCYGKLLRSQAEIGYQHLRKLDGVLLTGTAEKFETQVLGVTVVSDRPPQAKSPLRFLPQNCQLEYYGTCPGASTSHSKVRVTAISEHVADVMDSPNIYRGPKMQPEWFGWQKCLENMSVPATPFDHRILSIAVQDYKSVLMPVFESDLWNKARPLTAHENLCGIPGVKFMDAIKLGTSIGFPLTGCKRNYVTELEPSLEKPNNLELDQVILDEIDRCRECYKRGERAYTIAKACKKDEVLSKEKCRIFYGNPIALTYLVREYFLPILRVLQMNPLAAECAVGINKDGPEWEEFHNYILTHGDDHIIGGDYGKYDQKLPSQLIIAAIRILIDFARCCDYTENDLSIMEAMAGDLAYALIAFNGDLVGLTEGSHISGNSLTAVLNGICGSLNLRVFFYTQNVPSSFESRIPFREAVSLMTYGDDNIGSADPKYSKFTIKGISEFLATFGQTYTMPDKESELVDYLPREDLEFLKCTSVYHEDLGVHLGALSEKSMMKSLHCYIHNNNELTMEKRCADNLDGFARDAFAHGRDYYGEMMPKVREVANRANITHLCQGLNLTYDDRCLMWHEKYDDEILHRFEHQSGEEVVLQQLPLEIDVDSQNNNLYVDEREHSIASSTSTISEDLYVKAIREIPLRVIARDKSIITSSIGEVDLVFCMTVFGVQNYVYVEVKQSCGTTLTRRNARSKGKRQVKRITQAMSILKPKASHTGIVLDHAGYHTVARLGVSSTLPPNILP
mgnify:FL=1